jgi:hypothetical protein
MNRLQKIPKRVWVLVLICGLACVPVLIPVFIFASDAISERMSRIAFNSVIWKQSGWPNEVKDTRIKMVDDFISNHAAQGRSRDSIVALLGEPDGDPSIKSRLSDWDMHYYLGHSRGTVLFKHLDYDYLVFRLDGNGIVIAMRIVTIKT